MLRRNKSFETDQRIAKLAADLGGTVEVYDADGLPRIIVTIGSTNYCIITWKTLPAYYRISRVSDVYPSGRRMTHGGSGNDFRSEQAVINFFKKLTT